MNKTITALAEFLKFKNCGFQIDEDGEVLRSLIDGSNGQWRCTGLQDGSGRFVFVSWIPVKAPKPTRRTCAELLTRINAGIGLGHFGMDFDDGELSYRTTIPLSANGDLQPDVIEHVLDGHQYIVDSFIPVITAMLFARLTPEKALALQKEDSSVSGESRFSLN